MKNNIRVSSKENIVRNAAIDVRTEDENGEDVWTDIRHMVSGITWDVRVGEISRITLALVTAEVVVEGLISDATYEALASSLRLRGWTVLPPDSDETTP